MTGDELMKVYRNIAGGTQRGPFRVRFVDGQQRVVTAPGPAAAKIRAWTERIESDGDATDVRSVVHCKKIRRRA